MGLPGGALLADIDVMNVSRAQNVYAQGTRPNEGTEAGRMFRRASKYKARRSRGVLQKVAGVFVKVNKCGVYGCSRGARAASNCGFFQRRRVI